MNHISNTKQKGFAHVVLIVGLMIAIIGALGFIFWQNFIHKEPTTTQTNQATTTTAEKKAPEVAKKTVSFNDAFGVKLTFSYPADWTIDRKTEGPIPLNPSDGYTQETIKVTAPLDDIYVKYVMSANGGLGGICPSEDDPTAGKITSITSTPIKGFDGGSFVESVSNFNGKYSFHSSVMETAGIKDFKVGDLDCELGFQQLIRLRESNNVTLMASGISSSKFDPAEESGVASLMDRGSIDKLQATDTYKQAREIVLSTQLTK